MTTCLMTFALGLLVTLAPTDSPATVSYAGAWETTFGAMTLDQTGARVVGRYALGRLSGEVKGRRLVFEYVEAEERGTGWFELSADGRTFVGEWKLVGSDEPGRWTGTRVERNFSGLWETNFGRLRLVQTGDKVTGRYSLAGHSTIEGKIVDGTLKFRYQEPQAAGDGRFVLAPDASTFTGEWSPDGVDGWREWRGSRVEPEPGVLWLVILEAHWELSLAEREYAFGDMLRSYFTMAQARHVRVRHRFFHDLADFRRFSREVAYLAEPVVLLISTHGTEEGVLVGGETIGATAIADSVAGLGNVRLLHLSGCSMMNGSVPREILEALPEADRFPITGYSTPVAWDASALADFTFLSMVLIRRFEAREAVRQTHLVAPFTGSERVPGSAFAPLGLDVLDPKASPGRH